MHKKIIPNIITILNMICGLCAISLAHHMHFVSCLFIFAACVFDFLDGFIARKLKAQTKTGENLDSLADIISFGVAPTFIMFYLLQNINSHYIIYCSSFFITIAAAIRLSRFNINKQSDFIGLPCPAAAILISSISLSDIKFANDPQYYFLAIIIISLLMISKIKMFKIKNNLLSIIFLIVSTIIVIFYKSQGLSIAVFLYIAISIVKNKYEISSSN